MILARSALALTVCALPACSPNFMSFMKAPESSPVCSEDYGVVCRPPSRAGIGRDVEWVRKNVCPEKTELQYRSCYIPVGEQTFVYVRFR